MDNPTEQPTKYAPYPRGVRPYGSAEHLQAVADAYFGLSTAGLVAFMFGLVWPAFGDAVGHLSVTLLGLCIFLAGVGTSLAAYGPFRKLGTTRNWRPQTSFLLSILVGLVSPFCFGFFIIALAQSWPSRELRKYGLGSGFMGVNRKDIARKVQQMQEAVTADHLLDYSGSSLLLADLNSPGTDPARRTQ